MLRVLKHVVIAAVLLVVVGLLGIRVAGFEPLVVLTGSMEPGISPGDLMLARATDGPITVGEIYIGTVPSTGADTAHRVVGPGKAPDTWITRGDANPVADDYQLTTAQLSRHVVWTIPYAGYLQQALNRPDVRLLLLMIPVLILVWALVRAFVRRRARETEELPADPSGATESDGDAPAAVGGRTVLSTRWRLVLLVGAVGLLSVLALRMLLGLFPIVVAATTANSPLTGGSLALTRPLPVAKLQIGDVIQVNLSSTAEPSLLQITGFGGSGTDPVEGFLPFMTTGALAPGVEGSVIQLPQWDDAIVVVMQVPYLGQVAPFLETQLGFVVLLILFGLLAMIPIMILSRDLNRRSASRREEARSP